MDLNDVAAFVRVVDLDGFSAAARALGVPTSTVSRRVARLEEELGVRLMQRTTRRHHLTDAGRIFYERCAHVAEDIADAERAVAEMLAAPRGHLRITAPEDVGDRGWPVIEGFLGAYPDVTVELHLSQRFVDLVAEGYDVAIRGGELSDNNLVARKLAHAEQVLVASPDYLARRGRPDRVADLANHDCVVFPPWAPRSTWTLREDGATVSVPVKGRISVNHLRVVQRACASGLGVGRTVRAACAEALADGSLVEVLPGACPEGGVLWLVYPSRRHLSPAVRAFVDFVVENWEFE